MLKLHPQVPKKDGRKQFVILSYEEFQALQQRLLDADDLLALRRARRGDQRNREGLSLDELRAKLAPAAKPRRIRGARST